MDDPMQIGPWAQIPLFEVIVRASRSSGPGGQHANVTDSRIEAVFEIESSTALSETQKARLVSRFGPRVVAIAQDARSQSQNRELALERLRQRLESGLQVQPPRTPTRPTRSSQRKRVEGKRVQGQRKRERQRPDED